MSRFLLICLGSAAGGGLRYLTSMWVQNLSATTLPVGTFAVNFLGSFILAFLVVLGTETTAMSPTVRLALTTGLMGGFTTYSTFSYETLKYMQAGAWEVALGNILVTVTGCLAACWLGWIAARWLVRI